MSKAKKKTTIKKKRPLPNRRSADDRRSDRDRALRMASRKSGVTVEQYLGSVRGHMDYQTARRDLVAIGASVVDGRGVGEFGVWRIKK